MLSKEAAAGVDQDPSELVQHQVSNKVTIYLIK